MAISFVQLGSSAGYHIEPTVDPTLYTATFGTSPAEGDLLLLAISLNANSYDMTFQCPDGWIQLATWDVQVYVGEIGWYYRFATTGEGSTVEIWDTGAHNETHVMFITEWTGIDGDDPFHDGATFRGSQYTVAASAWITATVSGTRDMLYMSWGQWERSELWGSRATVGNGFIKRLDGHWYNDRFVQADYISTAHVPAACNWHLAGNPDGTVYRANIAVVGFSGSSGVPPPPPPATFAAGQYAFNNTVFGGLVNFAVPLEEMPDFYPVGQQVGQDIHTSHVGRAWQYDRWRKPVHRMTFRGIGTDTAATLGSIINQEYAFLFYDYVSNTATAGTGTYIFNGPYRRYDYGPDMCEFDFFITEVD